MKGIDVSKWQGNIDWSAVKNSGIEFAIIKAGGSDKGFYTDPKFEQNYTGATNAGIYVGAYYFVGSKCVTYDDGVADAKRFLEIIKGKKFEFPVYIDLESTAVSDKAGATQACIGFCKTMESNGYFVGIYASDTYGFKDRLNANLLSDYAKWVARYGAKPTYVNDYGIWQSSSSGKIKGINGNVDMDESVVNYPALIKKAGLNGFKTEYDKASDKLKRILEIINE